MIYEKKREGWEETREDETGSEAGNYGEQSKNQDGFSTQVSGGHPGSEPTF